MHNKRDKAWKTEWHFYLPFCKIFELKQGRRHLKFKLDHIGIVTNNIEDFLKIIRVLDPQIITDTIAEPNQKVAASFVRIGEEGEAYLEILEATSSDSAILGYLKKRGEGIHHLCFEVDDIGEGAKRFLDEGFQMVSAPADCSAYDENLKRECSGVSKIAFFLMKNRILIELIEKGK